MPWAYECKEKFVKQKILSPTVRRGPVKDMSMPGPNCYTPPNLFCGPGYSHIKKMPAYTFGLKTKLIFRSPYSAKAQLFDIAKLGTKGQYRIPGSVVSPQFEESMKIKVPGPGAYTPQHKIRYKTTPAYTCMPKAYPQYVPWDQWTPPPNLYLPPIMEKKPPAYTLGKIAKHLTKPDTPGPGSHDPNFNYTRKSRPAYSFTGPQKRARLVVGPSPNEYCEKRFNANRPTIPASSFGIRHSPFMGKQEVWLKESKVDLQAVP